MSLKKGKFQHNQSKSLWNYTLSPGWREEEVKILKSALQLFGIGKWKKILESCCLPGKSIGQIYMQTQRLLGQQSLGDFMSLQIDLEAVFYDNMKKQDVLRKNNCIINTGDNPTKEERKRRIEENRKKYGLTSKQIKEIRLPKVKINAPEYMTLEDIENEKFTNLEILTHLYNLKAEIVSRLAGFGDNPTKTILAGKHKEEPSQFSNSSNSETRLTLEKSGLKKYRILSVQESPLPIAKKIHKQKEIKGKGRKVKIESEEEEEDISLEEINSKSSSIPEQVVEEEEKSNKDEEVEEEEEDEDENIVNEEEIFEDGDEDDEAENSSSSDE